MSDMAMQDEEGDPDRAMVESAGQPPSQGTNVLATLAEAEVIEFEDEFDLTDDNAWVSHGREVGLWILFLSRDFLTQRAIARGQYTSIIPC